MSAAAPEEQLAPEQSGDATSLPPGRSWSPVVIGLLAVSGMLDFIDRFVFSSANEAIKHDLHLTDATVGLLGGTAFALLYGVMVLPLAVVSDRGYAARLAAGGIMLWSAATALMGRAGGIAMLGMARVGVGLGQAAYSPSSSSLNASYATLERRNTAFAVSYGGSYLGYIVGFAGGGYLVDHIGWRATFELVGLAGLPVAACMFLFIREPVLPHAPAAAESWWALARNRPLVDLLLFSVTSNIVGYAADLWGVSFYMRSFGMSAERAGAWFGFGLGVALVIGTFCGGPIADRAGRRGGQAGAMRFAFWAYLISQPFGLVQVLSHTLTVSLAGLVLSSLINGLAAAPVFAAIPTVVPAHRRAAAAALYVLLGNAVGIGVGPPLFGWISDVLTPHFGHEALRMSLVVAGVLGFWPALHLWQMQRHLRARAA